MAGLLPDEGTSASLDESRDGAATPSPIPGPSLRPTLNDNAVKVGVHPLRTRVCWWR